MAAHRCSSSAGQEQQTVPNRTRPLCCPDTALASSSGDGLTTITARRCWEGGGSRGSRICATRCSPGICSLLRLERGHVCRSRHWHHHNPPSKSLPTGTAALQHSEQAISDADGRPGTSSRRFQEAARRCSQNRSLQSPPTNGLHLTTPGLGCTPVGWVLAPYLTQ